GRAVPHGHVVPVDHPDPLDPSGAPDGEPGRHRGGAGPRLPGRLGGGGLLPHLVLRAPWRTRANGGRRPAPILGWATSWTSPNGGRRSRPRVAGGPSWSTSQPW